MGQTDTTPRAPGEESACVWCDRLSESGRYVCMKCANAARAAPVPTAHERLGVELSPPAAGPEMECEDCEDLEARANRAMNGILGQISALAVRVSYLESAPAPPYTRTDERLGLLEGRVEATMEAVSRLSARVSGLETKMAALPTLSDVVEINERLAALEKRLVALESGSVLLEDGKRWTLKKRLDELDGYMNNLRVFAESADGRLAALEKHIHYIERHDHVGLPIMCEPAAAAAAEEARATAAPGAETQHDLYFGECKTGLGWRCRKCGLEWRASERTPPPLPCPGTRRALPPLAAPPGAEDEEARK